MSSECKKPKGFVTFQSNCACRQGAGVFLGTALTISVLTTADECQLIDSTVTLLSIPGTTCGLTDLSTGCVKKPLKSGTQTDGTLKSLPFLSNIRCSAAAVNVPMFSLQQVSVQQWSQRPIESLMFNPMAPPSGSLAMLPEAAEITTRQTASG